MILHDAIQFAEQYHAGQSKKGTGTPFIYHPLAVASLVLKYGGDEAQAKAAILHDTIADGKVSEADLTARFGAEVARLAFTFADPEMTPEQAASWQESKKAYLNKLRSADARALLVVACEELHDGSELVHDLRYQGAAVWKRYSVHSMELFWYYRELLSIFHAKLFALGSKGPQSALVGEFAKMVGTLKSIVFENQQA